MRSLHKMERHKINLCDALRHAYYDSKYRFSKLCIYTSDGHDFHCPQNILASQSSLILREVTENNVVSVDIDEASLNIFLDYIYGDICDMPEKYATLYKVAGIMESDDIQERVSYYLRLNYCDLWKDIIQKLEIGALCEILDNDFINVRDGDEDIIYQSVVEIECLSPEDRDRIVQQIRFSCLSKDCRKRARSHPLMDTNDVFKNLILAENSARRNETYKGQRPRRRWPPAKICEYIRKASVQAKD